MRVSDARSGIGALVDMMNQTAMGSPQSALRPAASLSQAVGPFMSLDTSMSRYGSHMGPIVSRPNPSPFYQPDYSPDREVGAGRAGAPRGRGHGGSPVYDDEAGSINDDLSQATQQMIDFLHDNGCAVSPTGIVGNFQILYNRDYQGRLAVDDKYGPLTKAATDHVLADSQLVSGGETLPNRLTGYSSPSPCTYHSTALAPRTPAPSPAPLSPVATSTPAAPAPSPMLASMGDGLLPKSPLGWALLAGAVGLVAVANSKHPPRWSRFARFKRGRR